jgi:ABC-type multidrug transport system fused ATPase/permease subunit
LYRDTFEWWFSRVRRELLELSSEVQPLSGVDKWLHLEDFDGRRKPLRVKKLRRLAREQGRRDDQERRRVQREVIESSRENKLSLRDGVEPLAGDDDVPELVVQDAGFFTVYKEAPLFRLMTAFGSLFGGAVVGAGSSYVAKSAFRALVSSLGLPETLSKEFDKVLGGPALAAAVEQIGELLMDVYSAANSPQELWTALITPTGPTLASLCARVRAAQFMAESHGVAGVDVLERELYQLTSAVQRRHMAGVAVSWHLGTAVSSLIDSAEALVKSLRASQIVRPPFGLHFVGPAGSGKTQLMELIMTHMSSFERERRPRKTQAERATGS